jgi:hypothetical protein
VAQLKDLAVLLLLASTLLLPATSAGAQPTTPILGINYAMSYWHYDLQTFGEASTVRDFQFFASQGVKIVVLSPRWITLEPEEGVYNTKLIANLKRICELADADGMSVVIDFHVMSLKGNLHDPTWLPNRDLTNIITDTRYRDDFIAASKYLASQLDEEPNIHSFAMINEPHLGADELNVDKEQFISFIQDLRAAYRTVTSRPLSIRFDASLINQYGLDDRLFAACDYMDLNFYTKTFSENNMQEAVIKAKSLGKQVWVTEFGYSGSNDTAQEQDYTSYVAYFKTLGVDAIVPWVWKADSGTTTNPEPVGGGYNLAKDAEGDPRPAWYAFTKFAEQPPTDWTVTITVTSNSTLIQGFNVIVIGPQAYSIATYSTGQASFKTNQTGTYTLNATKNGYQTATGNITITQNTTRLSTLSLTTKPVVPDIDNPPQPKIQTIQWYIPPIILATVLIMALICIYVSYPTLKEAGSLIHRLSLLPEACAS